jgi:hypothetical protein
MEQIIYKGLTINIEQDTFPSDPLLDSDCFIGEIVCFHPRYTIGHEHSWNNPDNFLEYLAGTSSEKRTIEGDRDYHEYLIEKATKKGNIILPVYLYDHSGLCIQTKPFSCPWDSGQIGWIYTNKSNLKKAGHYWETITKERKERILKWLKSEIETVSNYISGDVYGYTIEETDDSCWGFNGSDHEESGLLDYARNSIDCHLKQSA